MSSPDPRTSSAAVDSHSHSHSRGYASVYTSLLWPAWERLRGRGTVGFLETVERTQWLTPEEIERFQLGELKRLLEHAGAHIPYYKGLFRAHRFDPRAVTSRNDLAVLPALTREIIRERYADLVDPSRAATNLKKGTSGSTGTPLKFEYSQESEWWRQAIKIRGYEWSGYRLGAPTYFYWAMVAALPDGAKGMKVRVDRAVRREVFVDSMKQDEASRWAALELLRRTRPKTIVCYTQSCAQFARWICDKGLRDWDDIPVLCGAEAVLAGDRAAIVRAFGPAVFETYGSRETMLLAAECDAHDGMHLSEENLLVEVTRDGKAVSAGETGEVLVTDLHNFGFPFIRYANGDLASVGDGAPCVCGRGLRKIAHVEGRRADTLTDRRGNEVPGIVFHVLFSDARREIIKQFQVVQAKTGEVTLKVVKGQDWSEEGFRAIRRRFSQYLVGVPVDVEIVEAILPSANGKIKTIISEK